MWEVFSGDCLRITLAFTDEADAPVAYPGELSIQAVWPGQSDPIVIENTERDDDAATLIGTFSNTQTECFPKGKTTTVQLIHTDEGCRTTIELGKVRVR